MNKIRRKELEDISVKLEDIKSDLEALFDKEEDVIANMEGGSLESTGRYERACEARDSLNEAISNLEEAISNIETAIEQ